VAGGDLGGAAQRRIGSIVAGKYQLSRILGVGGMGAVYEALHLFTSREVAVKLLHEDFAALPAVAKRFLQEAKATIHLKHPSIIEVLDAGQEADGKLYVVFELLRGEPFSAALRAATLPAEELVTVFIHLFDALQVAHDAGIVHRDIKPENVFLVRGVPFPGRIKLLDFGIARRVTGKVGDGITQVGAVLGTPRYMSPEVMMGEAVDPYADLWSMMVMMYRAFVGRLPFQGDTPEALLKMMVVKRAAPVSSVAPEVPAELASIIEKGLQVDRKLRYRTAAEVAQELRLYAPHLAGAAAPASNETDRPSMTSLPARPRIEVAVQDSQEWRPTQPGSSQYAWESALREIDAETAALEGGDAAGPTRLVDPAAPPKKSWLPGWLKRK